MKKIKTGDGAMFRYEYPVFESKKLLRAEMLDLLRDNPKNIHELCLDRWGNGIVAGCDIRWEKEVLTVEPGLVLFNKRLYSMIQEEQIKCRPAGETMYLKIQFSVDARSQSRTAGNGDIRLDCERPEKGNEMELGHFLLQQGARLRTSYENFEDYGTRYDTLDRIDVPYACEEESTMWTQLLRCFAEELLETGTDDVMDVSFCMQIMAHGGHIPRRFLRCYLRRKGLESVCDNQGIYRELRQILRSVRSGETHAPGGGKDSRGILLI